MSSASRSPQPAPRDLPDPLCQFRAQCRRRLLEHRDGAMQPSTVLCAFDASFCAGLLEALVQVAVDEEPILLVSYDADYPPPMSAKRPVPDAFGTALVLTPRREPGSLARIEAKLCNESFDRLAGPLEALRGSNPAARSLPLLRHLAMGRRARTAIEYLDGSSLAVDVEPCA